MLRQARAQPQLLTNEPAVLRTLRQAEDTAAARVRMGGSEGGRRARPDRPGKEADRGARTAGTTRRCGSALGTHAPAFGEATGGRTIPTGGERGPHRRTARQRRAPETRRTTGARPLRQRRRGLTIATTGRHCCELHHQDGGSPRARDPLRGARVAHRVGAGGGRSRWSQSPDCSARSASISGSASRSRSTCRSPTRPARQVTLGQYFGKRPVDPRARVLRVPDALHAGA